MHIESFDVQGYMILRELGVVKSMNDVCLFRGLC